MVGKRLLHDKLILFLVLVVGLLTVFSVLSVFLRVDAAQQITIIRYKPSLGLAGFERGSSDRLYEFGLFAAIVAVSAVIVTRKVYYLRRTAAILVLGLSAVVLVMNIVVSGALLNLQ